MDQTIKSTAQRYALIVVIAVLVFLLLRAWTDFSSQYETELNNARVSAANNTAEQPLPSDDLDHSVPKTDITPSHVLDDNDLPSSSSAAEKTANTLASNIVGRLITVTTDKLIVTINLKST